MLTNKILHCLTKVKEAVTQFSKCELPHAEFLILFLQ